MILTPFTKSDWEAFGGTEGNNPKIAYHEGCTIIADNLGLHIFINCDQDDYRTYAEYQLSCKQATAEIVASAMEIKDATNTQLLSDMGFVKVL